MRELASTLSAGATGLLWLGLCLQFVIRRGQSHREVLWATTGIAVSITLFLPPVAELMKRTVGNSGPCDLFMNVWGAGSSGLVLLAVAAFYGRAAVGAAVGASALVLAVVWWLAQITEPSPVGCVTSVDVPATSPFWWLLICWHLLARAAALTACRRDGTTLASDVWARRGIHCYTAGFASSALYWLMLAAVLITERRIPALSTIANVVLFPATVVLFAIAVWWPIIHRVAIYARDTAQFFAAYRGLAAAGWTDEQRRQLWQQSLRRWWRAPDRAAYRIRIARADRAIDDTTPRPVQEFRR